MVRKLIDPTKALLAAAVAVAAIAAAIGWNHSILDMHGFRQTQTAISAYWLQRGGPWLAYQTPVLGPPWSIPFEFPLYQWIVAALSRLFPLDQTGRAVSLFFYALSFLPLWQILGQLGLAPAARRIICSLVLLSPTYLFWSRTFMIESTAYCLAMAWLWASLKNRNAWALVFGILAALVKVTTFWGFVLCGVFALIAERRRIRVEEVLLRFVAPLAAAILWTRFADFHKQLNPLAENFITSGSMHRWNFGTAAGRLSPEIWRGLFERVIEAVGGPSILLVPVGLWFLPKARVPVVACLVAYFGVQLSFPVLHSVHSYYNYANAAFLACALGLLIASLAEGGKRHQLAAAAVLILTVACDLRAYAKRFYPAQRRDPNPFAELSQYLERNTAPRSVLLVTGLDWSSEIPYSSARRAVMDRESRPWTDPRLQRSLALLADPIGAWADCGAGLSAEEIAKRLDALHLRPSGFAAAGCRVYLSR
jgi:hypothetical protein